MKFNQLNIKPNKSATRKGRGISAGQGKTAGRGTKGQNARSGTGGSPGISMRQNSRIRSLPKLPGFTTHRTPAQEVYTGDLAKIKAKKIDNAALVEAGLITDAYHTAKIVVNGELESAKDVSTQSASKAAIEMIERAGGTFTRVDRLQRSKKADAKTEDKT